MTDPGTSRSGQRRPGVQLAPGHRSAGRFGWSLLAAAMLLALSLPAHARGPGTPRADHRGLSQRLAPPKALPRSDRADPPPTTRRERRRRAREGTAARFVATPPTPTPAPYVWHSQWTEAFMPAIEAPAPAPAVVAARVSLGSAGACLAPPPPDPSQPPPPQDDDDDEKRRPDPPVLQSRSGVPPFWIVRKYDTHATKAIGFPPLFVHRTPAPDHPERFLHLNPVAYGWYAKEPETRRWFSPALFFGGFSERKSVWAAAPLLMGYRRVGEQFNFGQFPFVWWWGTKFVKNVLVVPFHYQQRAPDGYRGVSALLFWYGNRNLQDADLGNDKRHFVAAPVFWRFSRGLKTLDISPLYVGRENKLKGLVHRTVLPLFLWQSAEFGNHKELWTMPFVRRTDKARRMDAWAVPPVLTFRHRGPDRSLLSATPLFWRGEHRLRGSRFTLAGLYGRYTDPRQSSSFFAPVWVRFADKQANVTTDVVLPLAVSRKTPQGRTIWTPLGGGGRNSRGWAAFALPVLGAAGHEDAGLRYQGVLGALWHVDAPAKGDKPRRDTWVLGPLAYGQKRGDGQTRIGLPPLLSFGSFGGAKRYQVVTPLFWHVAENTTERQRRTLVMAAWYHHRVSTSAGVQIDGGLPPLLFYGAGVQHRYAVVPWLATFDFKDVAADRHLTVSPLYVRSVAPDHRVSGYAAIAWDLRRNGERHNVLFPVYYRRQVADRTLTLTPLGGRLQRGDDLYAVFGLYGRRRVGDRDGAGVLPFVWVDKRPVEGGMARHLVVVPALLRRRTPEDDLDMWSPLVWRREIRGEGARKNLAIVPWYFRQRQPGGVDVDAGVGFFYARNDRRRTHTIIAGPAFHRLSRKGLNTGIAPLWWWHDSTEARRLIALPTIVHVEDKAKDTHTTLAVPVWFDRQRANGGRAWGVFPVVFGGRRLHNFTRFSVAPPGYFDIFRIGRNTRLTGHVPLLFRFQKCGFQSEDDARCRYTVWGSFPLFLTGRDGYGRRTHGSLVYYWDKRPEGWRLWTPAFGITNHPNKLLSWYGGPIAVRTTPTHRRVLAFPLYYRKQHRTQDSSLTLVAPPLLITRRRQDRRFLEAGLVFWQFRELHKVSTAIAPPIFFHSYAYKQRRRYWVAPILYRDNNKGEDKSLTGIAPLLYTQRRKGENLDFVQFPLVWHIERGTNQGTFGAFVWWDIRVKDKLLQLVPGAFTRWSTAERDTKVVGPFLGWWTKGKGVTEGDLHWRALFGLFGGGQENGVKYRAVFGRRIGATATATATPPPAAAPNNNSASPRTRRRAAR